MPVFSDFPHLVPPLYLLVREVARSRVLCLYSLWERMRMCPRLQVVKYNDCVLLSMNVTLTGKTVCVRGVCGIVAPGFGMHSDK